MLEVQARKTKVAGMTLAQNISRKELHEQRMEDLKVLPAFSSLSAAAAKTLTPFALGLPDSLLLIEVPHSAKVCHPLLSFLQTTNSTFPTLDLPADSYFGWCPSVFTALTTKQQCMRFSVEASHLIAQG